MAKSRSIVVSYKTKNKDIYLFERITHYKGEEDEKGDISSEMFIVCNSHFSFKRGNRIWIEPINIIALSGEVGLLSFMTSKMKLSYLYTKGLSEEDIKINKDEINFRYKQQRITERLIRKFYSIDLFNGLIKEDLFPSTKERIELFQSKLIELIDNFKKNIKDEMKEDFFDKNSVFEYFSGVLGKEVNDDNLREILDEYISKSKSAVENVLDVDNISPVYLSIKYYRNRIEYSSQESIMKERNGLLFRKEKINGDVYAIINLKEFVKGLEENEFSKYYLESFKDNNFANTGKYELKDAVFYNFSSSKDINDVIFEGKDLELYDFFILNSRSFFSVKSEKGGKSYIYPSYTYSNILYDNLEIFERRGIVVQSIIAKQEQVKEIMETKMKFHLSNNYELYKEKFEEVIKELNITYDGNVYDTHILFIIFLISLMGKEFFEKIMVDNISYDEEEVKNYYYPLLLGKPFNYFLENFFHPKITSYENAETNLAYLSLLRELLTDTLKISSSVYIYTEEGEGRNQYPFSKLLDNFEIVISAVEKMEEERLFNIFLNKSK